MTAEPSAALSVRISGKTKRYLDAVAEKKGIGVGKVLDQIVTELEQVPAEAAYLRTVAKMCYLNNFYLRLVLNRAGFTPAMEAQIGTVKKLADQMFGPSLPLPPGHVTDDMAAIPNEYAAMFVAFGVIDPTIVPKSSAEGSTPGSTATAAPAPQAV